MKPNWVGIVGWSLLLLAISIPFVSPIGAINGRALLVFLLAAGGVAMIQRAWQIPSENAARNAAALAEIRKAGPRVRSRR